MGQRRILLGLTPEKIGNCRYGPSKLLLLAIIRASEGDLLVIDGLDEVIMHDIVKNVLITEGFTIIKEEIDPPIYHIEAIKTKDT